MEPAQDGGHDSMVVVTCRFSKFLFAMPCFQTTATYVTVGVPLTIVSDRVGSQLIAEMWTSFMTALGIDARFSTPGHTQPDGAAERTIQSIRHMLRALGKDANSLGLWKAMLPRVFVSYNSTPHTTTGRASFYIMAMLRVLRPFLTINDNRPAWSEDDTRDFLDGLNRNKTNAIVRTGAGSARYHDQHRRSLLPADEEGR